MMNGPPKIPIEPVSIACSLSAWSYEERLAEIGAIGREGFLRAQVSPASAELAFRDTPALERSLASVIEAEGECCSFLSFSLRSEGAELLLSIAGPEAAAQIIRDLCQRFE